DARGYGASFGPTVTAFADYADDLFGVFDALHIERALVVGHSMGGRILLEAARRDQNRFAAMVLSGAQAAYLEHMTPAERQEYVAKREVLFVGDTPDPAAARKVAESVLAPDASAEAQEAMVSHFMALRREGFVAALTASVGMDARDVLPRITVPTQVVGGVLDPICPIEETRRIAASIGQGHAIEFAGVAHMANVEAPTLFADVVDAFVSTHAGAATVANANDLLHAGPR
ncbi:MAG: alpha/beta hydrolase, partial [Pseudomonadota bacterium]